MYYSGQIKRKKKALHMCVKHEHLKHSDSVLGSSLHIAILNTFKDLFTKCIPLHNLIPKASRHVSVKSSTKRQQAPSSSMG